MGGWVTTGPDASAVVVLVGVGVGVGMERDGCERDIGGERRIEGDGTGKPKRRHIAMFIFVTTHPPSLVLDLPKHMHTLPLPPPPSCKFHRIGLQIGLRVAFGRTLLCRSPQIYGPPSITLSLAQLTISNPTINLVSTPPRLRTQLGPRIPHSARRKNITSGS
jgi:hypothetical protein